MGKRKVGNPKTTWRRTGEKERAMADWKSWEKARTLAKDRGQVEEQLRSDNAQQREKKIGAVRTQGADHLQVMCLALSHWKWRKNKLSLSMITYCIVGWAEWGEDSLYISLLLLDTFIPKNPKIAKQGLIVQRFWGKFFQKIRKSAEFSMSKPFNRQFVKFWKGDEMKLLFSKKCWHTLWGPIAL